MFILKEEDVCWFIFERLLYIINIIWGIMYVLLVVYNDMFGGKSYRFVGIKGRLIFFFGWSGYLLRININGLMMMWKNKND